MYRIWFAAETMVFIWFLIFLFFNPINAQQYYDPSDCSENTNYPGSRYTCNHSYQHPCQTFLVYRASHYFKTISDVSQLFQLDPAELLHLNNLKSQLKVLEPGREVLVPIKCSCLGQFFQATFNYTVPENSTVDLSDIACRIFEGLAKPGTLVEENTSEGNNVEVGTKLHVPLKCACPDNSSNSSGVKYLVTYPLVEGDEPSILSEKFSISPVDLWVANNFQPWPTIYPNTTVLIPLKTDPVINFSIPRSPPPSPGFLPTILVQKTTNTKLRNLYIAGSVVGFILLLAALIVCGLHVKALRKFKVVKLQSFNTRSSQLSCPTPSSPRSGQLTGRSSATSCLSPDLLAGIKYSLRNYSIEDLKRATDDFSEERKIGDQAYKGLNMDNAEMMIKLMRFEQTRQVIDIHSKINHINILNLLGVCYGENDYSWSYLVFELPSNGCLRDLLSNSSNPLRWDKRTQIAFDIATALHYLHYCIFPTYAHLSVNSRNIFVTTDWRAKLTNIRTNPAVGSSRGNENIESVKGCVAPEYVVDGSVSEKVDIFAFGVVLLELISGKDDVDGKSFKECIAFLGGKTTEGGCFDGLRSFMDPCLKEDYPLAEALCVTVLAKACVEEDPLHRPSMDDILKVLVRMVR
jgi:LysM repeat protein